MLSISSCNEKFNKQGWLETGIDYHISGMPARDKMLKDLTKNYKLVGLTYPQLVDTLGPPDFIDSVSCRYTIIVHYDVIDPDYEKDLDFYFSKDSVISSFKICEWRKNQVINN